MSKKINNTSNPNHKNKKSINEQVLAKFQTKFVDPAQNSSRSRLKKLSEVNHDEAILPQQEQEDNQLEEEDDIDVYKQFDLKDDEDIKKQQEFEDVAKKNKKLKGNQQIDKFIEKKGKGTVRQEKEEKVKVQNKQLTLFDVMRIKHQKKKRRKSSDQFLASDNASLSSQINEEEIQARRLAAYEKYNGSVVDQRQLIQQAMKLSLATASAQKENIQDFSEEKPAYQLQQHEIGKPLKLSAVKDKVRQKSKQEVVVKKQTKVKSKSSVKQTKVGPLAGLIIVFTGQFQLCTKDELIEVCEQLGAECPKSLTKKCQILIQGSYVMDHYKRRSAQLVTETTKSLQAKKRGIDIISYEEIDNFFQVKTGFSLDHHIMKNKVQVRPLNFFMHKSQEERLPSIKQENQQKMMIEGQAQNRLPAQRREKVQNNTYQRQNKPYKPQIKMQIEQFHSKKAVTKDNRLWTQKHKPTKLQEVIGQNNQIKSLREWLQNWQDIHIRGNKRQVKQSKGWNAGNINSKAALISGDPGIGKTTTARLLASQYYYSVSQFNASDIRNKSGINLMETGSFNLDQAKNLNKSLIIMDEVDGMSSGDRGGITAMINLIKNSRVPIICICNDRQSQKIRSLAGHCLDVKFFKPHKGMLVQKLKSILVQEGGSGEDRALQQLIQAFQNDMRQILSYLQVIFRTVSKKITLDALSSKNKHSKDASVMINHFDAARKLLNRTQFSRMKISERTQCFFVDSDMVPLMIHENILNSAKKTKFSLGQFHSLVEGLKGMAIGDMLDRTIRKEQQWGLMPSFGFMTCVYSTEKISESMGFPQFPSWLGKFSSQRKVKRLSKELKDFIYPQTLCSNWKTIKSHYAPIIINELIELLKQQDIEMALEFMQTYNITPAIISEHLTSLNQGTEKTNPMASIPTAIKTKLTKAFNKRHEDARLKQGSKANMKGKAQNMKYNLVLEQAENEQSEQVEQSQKQSQAVVKAKGKGKKK